MSEAIGPDNQANKEPSESFIRWHSIRNLVSAGIYSLQTALEFLRADHFDEDRVMDLDSIGLAIKAVLPSLERPHQTMVEACEILDADKPFPYFKWDGMRWGGPQRPETIISLSRMDIEPDFVSYWEIVSDKKLRESTQMKCNAPGCRGYTAKRADGTRALTCWLHTPSDEKAQITEERKLAVSIDCPTCKVPAGTYCYDEKFDSSTIHNKRLTTSQTMQAQYNPQDLDDEEF